MEFMPPKLNKLCLFPYSMKTIFIRNIHEVEKNLPILQKKLKVGLKISEHQVSITGKEENIYFVQKVLEALDIGFSIENALLLSDPDYLFEVMNIKDFTRRSNLEDIRARIVGTKGKTKKLMERLSECLIKLKGNIVYIIGPAEDMRNTMTAVERLIRGSAQGKVYGFLERSRTQHKNEPYIKINNKSKKDKEGNEEILPKFPYKIKIARKDHPKKAVKKKLFKHADKFSKYDDLTDGIDELDNPDENGLEDED